MREARVGSGPGARRGRPGALARALPVPDVAGVALFGNGLARH